MKEQKNYTMNRKDDSTRGRGSARARAMAADHPAGRGGPSSGRGAEPYQSRGPGAARGWGAPQQGAPQQRGAPQQGAPQQRGAPPQGAWGGQSQAPQGAWSGRQPQQQPAQPQGAWGSRQPQQQQPPPPQQPQRAWGARPQPSVEASRNIRAPTPQQPPSSSTGRATVREGAGDTRGAPSTSSGYVADAGRGQGDSEAGRGGIRGRRTIENNVGLLLTRPKEAVNKKGSTGAPLRLTANYFRMLSHPNWCLYQYRVDFAPSIDLTPQRKTLFRQAIRGIDLSGYIFDGTVFFSSRRLPEDSTEFFVQPDENSPDPIRVTVRHVANVDPMDYHYLQVFNLLIRKCMRHLKLQLIGRNYFDPHNKQSLPNLRMELWPGYITSIRQHENEILLCADIAHKFMRNETALDLLMECRNNSRNYQADFHQRMVGCTVLTDYNNKTYRIDDVDFSNTPRNTFQRADGTEISYMDYYKQKHGINIQNQSQPMLISNSKPREIRMGMAQVVVLIPELCRCTGLTEQQRSNMLLMKELCKITNVGPRAKISMLQSFSRRVTENARFMDDIKQWDFQLATNLLELTGRLLPAEAVSFGNRVVDSKSRSDWSTTFRNIPMYQDGEIREWVIIHPQSLRHETRNFEQQVTRLAKSMSMRIPPPAIKEIPDDRISTFVNEIQNAYSRHKELSLITCMVTNNKADRYAAIKKKTLVDLGINSQVVTARILKHKSFTAICGKILVQISTKVGGAPWTVSIPANNLMIVGYDACHDPNGKERSYGAVVCSLNKECTRYYTQVASHPVGEEMSNYISISILNAMEPYYKIHKAYPGTIVIYRDGVGDGQIQYVYEHELRIIVQSLNNFYKGKGLDSVKLLFQIVTKRSNTRLFANGENPLPGTIVDDSITLPERYDYFLVSQCTRQGTISPTYYNIIYNTSGFSADQIQRLTYKMTHLYYNMTGTVSVPAPCQYAHKGAFLAAQSLKQSVHQNLNKYLYYL